MGVYPKQKYEFLPTESVSVLNINVEVTYHLEARRPFACVSQQF